MYFHSSITQPSEGARRRSEGSGVFFFCRVFPCVCDTLGEEAPLMPDLLVELEQRRAAIAQEIVELGDLRPGSITGTSGLCGKPSCRCHQPGQPVHGPNLRLTYKIDGKTISESLPDSAAIHKAEREVAEFRKFQEISHEFVEVNARIC